jgi:uncharacterized protein YaiE (UPF0345 family)
MENFKNVELVPKANTYFDGAVTSRTFILADGSKKSLGIMMPGEYTFGTEEKELMEILAGTLQVKLPGSDSWTKVEAGQSFKVPGKSSFNVKVEDLTAYGE